MKDKQYKRIFRTCIIVFIIFVTSLPINAAVSFTREEKDYIKNRSIIKAASPDGVAPLHYTNSQGEIKGHSQDAS